MAGAEFQVDMIDMWFRKVTSKLYLFLKLCERRFFGFVSFLSVPLMLVSSLSKIFKVSQLLISSCISLGLLKSWKEWLLLLCLITILGPIFSSLFHARQDCTSFTFPVIISFLYVLLLCMFCSSVKSAAILDSIGDIFVERYESNFYTFIYKKNYRYH